jgi:small conductance mechanosensitive channel
MWQSLFEVLKPYLNVVLIGVGGLALAFILSQITNRLFAKRIGAGWGNFLSSLIALAVVIWTLNIILKSTGAAGLVVVLVTVITAAFALGSEHIVNDLVAGVSLFVSQIYKPGDFVFIAGYEGRVVNTSLWTTTLENAHGDYVYIRNSDVKFSTIVNHSIRPERLISVKVPISINQDIHAAVAAVEQAIAEFSPNVENVNRPKAVIESVSAGYVALEVQAYAPATLDYGSEKNRLYFLVLDAIANAGVKPS